MNLFTRILRRLQAAPFGVTTRPTGTPDEPLVSVVIPFLRNLTQLRAAIASVLGQSYPNIEILVVYDDEQDISPAVPPGLLGKRVFGMKQDQRGGGAARNFGVARARGEYVAFLDSDDVFLPTKVERQLKLMREAGARFSHTSYFTQGLDNSLPSALIHSGTFSGAVFPGIMGYCPIATPTIMARTGLLRAHPFPQQAPNCEDFVWIVLLSSKLELLGIDEPLTVVTISPETVAYNAAKHKKALECALSHFENHPATRKRQNALDRVRALIEQTAVPPEAPVSSDDQVGTTAPDNAPESRHDARSSNQ